MIRSDAGAATAALQPPTVLHVLTHNVGVEASPQLDSGEVSLLAVDGVVVSGRQQDGHVLLAQLGPQFGRHRIVEGGHATVVVTESAVEGKSNSSQRAR